MNEFSAVPGTRIRSPEPQVPKGEGPGQALGPGRTDSVQGSAGAIFLVADHDGRVWVKVPSIFERGSGWVDEARERVFEDPADLAQEVLCGAEALRRSVEDFLQGRGAPGPSDASIDGTQELPTEGWEGAHLVIDVGQRLASPGLYTDIANDF